MMSGNQKVLAATVVLAAQMFFPLLTEAGGIGITPAVIEMNDALRGNEYQHTIILTNAETGKVKFEFAPEGEAGGWATIYPYDGPEIPITSFVAPPGSDVRLRLKLRLPNDAPNGLHTGRIVFRSAVTGPEGESGSVMSVSVGIGMDLKISVTGMQKMAGKVGDVSLLDVEVDQPPLRLTSMFMNTGNVNATPNIRLQMKDYQGKVVGEAIFNEVTVEPGATTHIESKWDHSGKPAGKYVAAVTVSLENEQIFEREIAFQILPKGTMTRVGKLDEIRLASQPQAGGTVKLVGLFQNTGKIDTRAVLVAEIYRGANLLRMVESRETVVPAGQVGEIELFFDIPAADAYMVKAKVNYEGKLTVAKEISFTVAGSVQGPSTSASEGPALALVIWLAAGIVTLLVSLIVAWMLWRRRAEEQARRRITRFGS